MSNIIMLNKDTIIKITNSIANTSAAMVGSRYVAGVIIALFHLIIVAMIVYFFFFSSTDIGFVIGVGGFLTIIILHFLFRGCFLLRIERTLFNNKHWYNFFNLIIFPLEKIGVTLNKDNIYNIVTIVDLLLLYVIYVKLRARLA